MVNYWLISPYDAKDTTGKSFEEIWNYDLINGTIAIGASSLQNSDIQDYSLLSQKQLEEEISKLSPDWKSGKVKRKARAIWELYHLVEEGDFILAKRGKKVILAVGKAINKKGRVSFCDKKLGLERAGNNYNSYPNFINVKWFKNSLIDYGEDIFLVGRFGDLNKKLTSIGKRKLPDILRRVDKIAGF